jgi:GTP cyclohydrolase I
MPTQDQNISNDVLNCAIQDDKGLNDFQKLPSLENIAIPRVGVERFRIPMRYAHPDGEIMNHDTEASMYIYLSGEKTGANMSRFCAILQEEAQNHVVGAHFFKLMLGRYRSDLRDFENEELISRSELALTFKYGVKQPSLKSGNWGWQYYNCTLKGTQSDAGQTVMEMTVNYEYSSTCPCSLSMAKQYEEDYKNGTTTEGNGIATAHSQRSNAQTTVLFDLEQWVDINDLIALLREALPTETQSLVKRVDEQAFAILNGENPIFVEHVARRLNKALNSDKRIIDWQVKIEHFESLHSHNAVAYISK